MSQIFNVRRESSSGAHRRAFGKWIWRVCKPDVHVVKCLVIDTCLVSDCVAPCPFQGQCTVQCCTQSVLYTAQFSPGKLGSALRSYSPVQSQAGGRHWKYLVRQTTASTQPDWQVSWHCGDGGGVSPLSSSVLSGPATGPICPTISFAAMQNIWR